jgi:hypothetical protein
MLRGRSARQSKRARPRSKSAARTARKSSSESRRPQATRPRLNRRGKLSFDGRDAVPSTAPLAPRDVSPRPDRLVCPHRQGAAHPPSREFGSPEFEAEYHSAIGGNTPPAKAEPSAGTLGWLIARYRETSAWLKLAAATRRQREPAPTQVGPDRFAQKSVPANPGRVGEGADRRCRSRWLHFNGIR